MELPPRTLSPWLFRLNGSFDGVEREEMGGPKATVNAARYGVMIITYHLDPRVWSLAGQIRDKCQRSVNYFWLYDLNVALGEWDYRYEVRKV